LLRHTNLKKRKIYVEEKSEETNKLATHSS